MSKDRIIPDTGASARGETPAEVASIPLVEERLAVSKRQVESGRLLVHVNVEEREEIVAQQLARDEVEVEHVPRNIPVSEIPHVRLEGNTTIVPVVEEVLVVEKRLMLVEEIHIRRRSALEQHETSVTLRSERARVERQGPSVAEQSVAAPEATR
jgi:uncharacterized protein (TIGR02271 family)